MNTMENPASQSAGKKRFKFLRRFCKDERGSNAIEFVILIFPFTLLMFAVIETGVSFGGQQLLSNAADDVARSLRTNVVTQANATPAAIRDAVCDQISFLVATGCPGLEIDLRSYANFRDIPLTIPRTASGDLDTSGFQIAPGPGGSRNHIRVFYRWPVMADFMRKHLAELPNGYTLLFTSLTWKNEPFE
jgi:Flp pilus assembly protein TadG